MTATSRARMFVRHLAYGRGPGILIAVMVLVATLVAALAPRALDALFTAELRHSVSTEAATQRDLVATTTGPAYLGSPEDTTTDLAGPLADVFGGLDSALAGMRERFPEPLASAAGEPRFVSFTTAAATPQDVRDPDAPEMFLAFAVDPRVEESLSVVDGAAPAALPMVTLDEPLPEDQVIEMVLSAESAEAMRWEIGEQRMMLTQARVPAAVLLTGIVEPVDASADYWAHITGVLDPVVIDDGNRTPIVTATAYVDPLSLSYFAYGGTLTTTAWIPLQTGQLDFATATELATALRSFTSSPQPVEGAFTNGVQRTLSFTSALSGSLDAVIAKAATAIAVLALTATGPLGVLLAVFTLASRALIERRRAALGLGAARGGSSGQLRGLMAFEGLLLGVPAAAVAVIAVALLVPAAVGWTAILLPGLIGLVPAVLLALAATGGTVRAERSDVGSTSRFGWIIEVTVVALALTATFLLFQRGIGPATIAVDPLVAATPLLLSLAVCVGVLRLYPLPLRALENVHRRGSGLSGFVGSARALRSPAAGVAPVLAMVVGVAVAVFSSVLLTTIDNGVDAAANGRVGADMRADGPVFDSDMRDRILELEGVDAVAGIDVLGPGILGADGARSTVTVMIGDLAALRDVRGAESPVVQSEGDTIAVVASRDLVDSLDDTTGLQLESRDISIEAVAEPASGIAADSRWMMADVADSEALTTTRFLPRTIVLSLDDDADTIAIAGAVAEIGGPLTTVVEPGAVAANIRESPVVSGIQVALVLTTALVALLGAIALVMTSVVAAPARLRLLALLRTLGASARHSSALAAWELVPVAVTGIVAGVALGLGLPYIVTAAVDLRPFTGGAAQPAVSIDPVLVACIIGAFVIVVAAAVVAAVALGRRVSAATTLRMGEQ